MKRVIIYLSLVTFLYSCGLQRKYATNREESVTETQVYKQPLLGEVKVDITRRVSAEVTVGPNQVEYGKELAIREALKSDSADIIIDPVFDINTTATKTVVNVVGYPAYYTEIKTATPEELKKLYAYDIGVENPNYLNLNDSIAISKPEPISNSSYESTSTDYLSSNKSYEPRYKELKGYDQDMVLTRSQRKERNIYRSYEMYKNIMESKGKKFKYTSHEQYYKSVKRARALLGVILVALIAEVIVLTY